MLRVYWPNEKPPSILARFIRRSSGRDVAGYAPATSYPCLLEISKRPTQASRSREPPPLDKTRPLRSRHALETVTCDVYFTRRGVYRHTEDDRIALSR